MAERTMWREGERELSRHENGSVSVTVKLESIGKAFMLILDTEPEAWGDLPEIESATFWALIEDGGLDGSVPSLDYHDCLWDEYPWSSLSVEDQEIMGNLLVDFGMV